MNDLLRKVEEYVTGTLKNAEAGHDIWHIKRVVKNAVKIHEKEGGNRLVILLAAWLHDIADAKFHQGDEETGPRKAVEFMKKLDLDKDTVFHVENIIRNISFKNQHFEQKGFESLELHIVRDADRLDAIGAIGVARTFHFGGFKNNPIYIPDIPLNREIQAEEYKKYKRPTIHHFYDKLLKIKDMLHTETAKKMAEERHRFLELFLDRFFKEWDI
jgi:uncharacterized protein